MSARVWHYVKETDLPRNSRMRGVAQMTLTLTVDNEGNFLYTDMGLENLWSEFCGQLKIDPNNNRWSNSQEQGA